MHRSVLELAALEAYDFQMLSNMSEWFDRKDGWFKGLTGDMVSNKMIFFAYPRPATLLSYIRRYVLCCVVILMLIFYCCKCEIWKPGISRLTPGLNKEQEDVVWMSVW